MKSVKLNAGDGPFTFEIPKGCTISLFHKGSGTIVDLSDGCVFVIQASYDFDIDDIDKGMTNPVVVKEVAVKRV